LYEEHGKIVTDKHRIEFMNRFLIDIDKHLKAFTLPVCPSCKDKNLHLVLGSSNMLMCKTKTGGCGSVFDIRVKNSTLIPVVKS
jgi:hypothetical protein